VKKWMVVAFIVGVLGTSAGAMDLSSVDITANTSSTTTYVQILITDPLGRQTGLPSIGESPLQNIPGSSYFPESFGNEETGAPGVQIIRFGMTPVVPGSYTVVMIGLADGNYSMNIGGNDTSGNPTNFASTSFSGLLRAGTSQQYSLSFDPTPGANNSISKSVSFDSLEEELEAAFQIGQIGDAVFVSELNRILTDGEAALSRPNHGAKSKQVAIADLWNFIRELEDAAQPRKRDGDWGRDDRQKRIVAASALLTLTTDAKAMIKSLEPNEDRHLGARPEDGGKH